MGKPVAAAMLPDSEPLADPEAAESEDEASELEVASELLSAVPLAPLAVREPAACEMLLRMLVARAVPLLKSPESEDATAPVSQDNDQY